MSLMSCFRHHSRQTSQRKRILRCLMVLIRWIRRFRYWEYICIASTRVTTSKCAIITMAIRPIFTGILSRRVTLTQGRRQMKRIRPQDLSTNLSQSKCAKDVNSLLLMNFPSQFNRVRYALVDMIPQGIRPWFLPKLRTSISNGICSLSIRFTRIRRTPCGRIFNKSNSSFIFRLVVVDVYHSKCMKSRFVSQSTMHRSRIMLYNTFQFRIHITRLPMMRIIRTKRPRSIFVRRTSTRLFTNGKLRQHTSMQERFPPINYNTTLTRLFISSHYRCQNKYHRPIIGMFSNGDHRPQVANEVYRVFRIHIRPISTHIYQGQGERITRRPMRHQDQRMVLLLMVAILHFTFQAFVIKIRVALMTPIPFNQDLRSPLTTRFFFMLTLRRSVLVPRVL